MIGSVLIVTLIYAVIMLLINAVLPWQEISNAGGIAVVEVAKVVLGGAGALALTGGGLLATASSANASILASSRINFAMGRDKLVTDWLNAIHDRFATPHRSIALTGGLILLFIVIGDVKTLAKAGSVLHLIVYGLLNLALIVMREADVPDYQPDYRVPLYPVVPILGAIASFGLIAFMDGIEILLSLLFVVVAVHIVEVPYQVPLGVGAEHVDELDAESKELMAAARHDAETYGVNVETHTIFSHRVYEAIFDAAQDQRADVVVLGWDPDAHGSPGRVESFAGDLLGTLSCDFVVFKDRGFDPSRVLVPTRGGPGSEVSADVARTLRDEFGAEITLLNVTDDPDRKRTHTDQLAAWANAHGLSDATQIVDVADSVDGAIATRAPDHTLLLGASEEGLLTRLTGNLGPLDVVEKVNCSVLLTETAHERSLMERLFGSRTDGFDDVIKAQGTAS